MPRPSARQYGRQSRRPFGSTWPAPSSSRTAGPKALSRRHELADVTGRSLAITRRSCASPSAAADRIGEAQQQQNSQTGPDPASSASCHSDGPPNWRIAARFIQSPIALLAPPSSSPMTPHIPHEPASLRRGMPSWIRRAARNSPKICEPAYFQLNGATAVGFCTADAATAPISSNWCSWPIPAGQVLRI